MAVMTTQPKDLMTLEETIDFLTHLRNEAEMSRDAAGRKADIAKSSLQRVLYEEQRLGWSEQLSGISSALHHLEAGRKGCGCGAFQMAQQDGTDNEMYGKAVKLYGHDQEFHIGCDLPPISFCPWCGGKVPTAQEVRG